MTLKVIKTEHRLIVRATGADAAHLLSALATQGLEAGLESVVIGLNAVPKRSILKTQASGAATASSGSSASLLGAA